MIDIKKLDSVLPYVEKPARYVGAEMNVCPPDGAEIRFLFAFPDVYEVGMSHLGTAILYNLFNTIKYVGAERTFAPFVDMQKQMSTHDIPLYSLETFTPASEFDIVGFNLSYEMCYTTVLKMLELSRIPLRSQSRDERFPLIIAGGACVCNPEPLADFIDLFVIGEGEEVSLELLELYRAHKPHYNKAEFLKAADKIEGIYVPSLYSTEYNADKTIKCMTHKTINKRFIRNMDAAYYFEQPVVPCINIVHDRAVLEVMRGCTRGCRFCQAGFIYRPVREKSADTLINQADALVNSTGYDEISLSSLSTGDYSQIDTLATSLIDRYDHVSVSLPSLRVDSFGKEYAKKMETLRKSSFTFAPEAGTQRLRDVINKNITDEDILRGIGYAYESGCTTIKLYFMIGLPTETYEDLQGIASTVAAIKDEFYKLPKAQRKGRLQINVSTACFVPKPFTPFEWYPQDTREVLYEKIAFLRDKLKIPNVKYNYHNPELSYLEAVFSRGDRRLGAVLEYAQQNGAMFDSWQDYFSADIYARAFEHCGVDPDFYATRPREFSEILPFDFLNYYVTKEFLIGEWEQSVAEKCTPDCRQGCLGCGFEEACLCE